MTRVAIALLAATLLLAIGCGDDSKKSNATPKPNSGTTESAAAQLPTTLFSATPLDNVVTLNTAREGAAKGSTVTFLAHIAGRAKPFTEGRAVMTVADLSLPACTDGCAAPWDLCCEPADVIARSSATVQVVGADGKPLKLDLNRQGGLAPGAEIHVRGNVADVGEGYFVVNAVAIHVAK